jgi:hypothetical protein
VLHQVPQVALVLVSRTSGRRRAMGFAETVMRAEMMRDSRPVLDRPFLGSEAVARGLLTRGHLRGRPFRRLFPDVYVPADAPDDLATRSRAAFLLTRGRGVLGGYSAAELLAARCAPRDAPAEVIVPGGELRTRSGLVVHRDVLAADEVRTVSGVGVTTSLRTAYDLARWCPLVEAVVAMDALAARDGFAPGEVLELARRYPRARGRRALSRVVELADPKCDSAMETRLRMLMVLGGLPTPVVQHPVADERAHVVAWLDLAYPEHRLGIEYDGLTHAEPRRYAADLRRHSRLLDLGWRVYRFTAADVLHRPDRTLALIARALREPHGGRRGA